MENHQKDIEQLWEMIESIRFGMLTHIHPSGALQSYPLTTQNKTFDQTNNIYFFIPQSGDLYHSLMKNNIVNIAYASAESDQYISLSGNA